MKSERRDIRREEDEEETVLPPEKISRPPSREREVTSLAIPFIASPLGRLQCFEITLKQNSNSSAKLGFRPNRKTDRKQKTEACDVVGLDCFVGEIPVPVRLANIYVGHVLGLIHRLSKCIHNSEIVTFDFSKKKQIIILL